jgi:hypothetical protein
MDDLRTRAQLVDFDRAGAIGTVFSRTEIAEAAAGDEFPATLLLDLDRTEADGTARARVAVDWDQETLEKLLASTEDEEIQLWFDERELALAFDDVEAHGLREKAAVLAVAVAAAGVSTTPAFARMAADSGGGNVAPASATATGAERGLAQDRQLSQSLSSGEVASRPDPAGDKAAVLAGAERGLAQDRQLSQSLGSGQVASRPDPVGDKTAVLAGTERGLVQDHQLSQNLSSGQAAVTSSSGGSTFSTGELAGAIAGGALLISAAGFGVARKRTSPVQPA